MRPQNPKYRNIIIILCILLISGPILVHLWTLIPVHKTLNIIAPQLSESDMLTYYISALGCFSTAFLAYVALKQSDQANRINDQLLDLQKRSGKEAFVGISKKNVKFVENTDNHSRYVTLKFNNITGVPIDNIEIEESDRKIIDYIIFEKDSKGDAVFMSKYDGITYDLSDPISGEYRFNLKNYGEDYRILSFKVVVTSLYGVTKSERWRMLDFTAFFTFFVTNLLLVQS